MYARVRRACMVEGMSIREAAREFGLHRDAVRKMLKCSGPSGYGGASLSDDRSWSRALVHHQRGTFLRPILDLDALETIRGPGAEEEASRRRLPHSPSDFLAQVFRVELVHTLYDGLKEPTRRGVVGLLGDRDYPLCPCA